MKSAHWKQEVANRILQLANSRGSLGFSLEEIYAFESNFTALFPKNRYIRQKLRQTLQRLRDDGLLVFDSRGEYSLNIASPEIVAESTTKDLPTGTECPPVRSSTSLIRLRNTMLGLELKRRYDEICQVCRVPLRIREGKNYAEAHHLKPLGAPHEGPDVPGNIVVLCPNHHVMFDRGAATIVPGTFEIKHHVGGVFPAGAHLYLEPWHKLSRKYLEYHHRVVFRSF